MKKMILLATFVAAGLINAKTSEIKVSEMQTTTAESKAQLCSVSVTYYDADGNVSGYNLITSDQSSLENCKMWQSLVKHRLQKQGFTLTQQ